VAEADSHKEQGLLTQTEVLVAVVKALQTVLVMLEVEVMVRQLLVKATMVALVAQVQTLMVVVVVVVLVVRVQMALAQLVAQVVQVPRLLYLALL
jgi:hypothetical protein